MAARPRVWWHWMNGNVDEEGIKLDLEWMARIGIGGAQAFEGGMNTPQVVSNRIVFGSAEWSSAMRFAASTADRLGLELTIATSAGWSAAGAPWVDPVDAMVKCVWSETLVEGGKQEGVALNSLPTVAGPFQDVPRWGSPTNDPRLARDTFVIAIPATTGVLLPETAWTSQGQLDPVALTDGLYSSGVSLPRDLDSASTEWITYRFAEPTSVGAVTLGLPGPRGFGSPPPVHATLESSSDGDHWAAVVELPATSSPVRSRSFAPVSARWFRARLDGSHAASGLPPMHEGVLPLPFPPASPLTVVSQFALWADGRISAAEEKAGFGIALDYRGLDGPPEQGVLVDQVLDVTGNVTRGVLNGELPPGTWRILRFGYSLTGRQNGPAPVEATGLEVDKLDPNRVEAYLHRWLDLFREAVGDDLIGQRGIRSILSDSIESGPQNWTSSLPTEFENRRGYSLVSWLPTIAGYIVGDSEQSDRVLADLRRTIAELAADSYYGTVAKIAHSWGLSYYAEALEDHRPQLGDDVRMRSHADIPMGAMWMYTDDGGPAPTYVADLRGASSAAHVYGKQFTGAESMSAFGRPYVFAPSSLKPVADLELILGVTRFCIHTSPHQPSEVRAPGISLTPHLGQTFTRHETWAELAGPWITYLARASYLLNLGDPAVDIAYIYSDGDPLTAVFGDHPPADVPPGHAWDFVSADALETCLTVDQDGTVLSLGGAHYRLIYLGGWTEQITLSTLRQLARLVDQGATLIGAPPLASPSAADDQAVFAAEVIDLWSSPRVQTGPLDPWLDQPDWIAPGLDVVHRTLPEAEIYFVRNPADAAVSVTASFRSVATGAEWWDAVTGTRVSGDANVKDGRTVVKLDLPAYGSGFLVIRQARNVIRLGQAAIFDTISDWKTTVPDDTGFSGRATYEAEVFVNMASLIDARLYLRLDQVHDLAEVVVNGQFAGVAWTHPFEVDITDFVAPGANLFEVSVTNTWANRLIADAASPTTSATQTTAPIYKANAPKRPWGLRGPGHLIRRSVTASNSAYS